VPPTKRLALVGFVAALGSSGTIQKYAGTAAALVYLVVAAAVLPFVWPRLEALAEEHLQGSRGVAATAVVLAVLVVALALVYPHANTHSLTAGSDRDDSVNIGAMRLLHGEYPYSARTYLGLPLAQMPGAFLLGLPFAAASSSAWATPFWIAVLIALVALSRGLGVAALAAAAVFVTAPAVPREYLTGGDLVSNTIYVVAGAWLVFRFAGSRFWPLAGVAFGVALASRSNFAFLLIPLLAAVSSREGVRAAVRTLAVAVAAALALTIPFILRQDGWDAIVSSNRLAPLGRVGEALTLLAAVALAVWLAVGERRWRFQALVWQAALVQAIFPLVLVVQASVEKGAFDAEPLITGYGVPSALLCFVGAAMLAHAAEAPTAVAAPTIAQHG
jgi:hypothetical protein